METFRGTSFGHRARQVRENRLAWEMLFQPRYNATVFGVSGEGGEPKWELRPAASSLQCTAGVPWWEGQGRRAGVKAKAPAAAGDRSAHVLWRIQNGEGPQGINTRLTIALTGTNDVNRCERIFKVSEEGAGRCCDRPCRHSFMNCMLTCSFGSSAAQMALISLASVGGPAVGVCPLASWHSIQQTRCPVHAAGIPRCPLSCCFPGKEIGA